VQSLTAPNCPQSPFYFITKKVRFASFGDTYTVYIDVIDGVGVGASGWCAFFLLEWRESALYFDHLLHHQPASSTSPTSTSTPFVLSSSTSPLSLSSNEGAAPHPVPSPLPPAAASLSSSSSVRVGIPDSVSSPSSTTSTSLGETSSPVPPIQVVADAAALAATAATTTPPTGPVTVVPGPASRPIVVEEKKETEAEIDRQLAAKRRINVSRASVQVFLPINQLCMHACMDIIRYIMTHYCMAMDVARHSMRIM
jgi:hypothetical protein